MNSYIDWKNWASDSFGRFNALEARYYALETGIAAKPGVRVLEVGFGNGPFIGWARSRNLDIFGVELNSTLVARARAMLGEHHVFQDLDDQGIKTLAGTFSHVVAFDVIEHIPQDALPKFFSQIKALLASDGRVFLRFPNGDSPFGRIIQHGDPTHVTTIGRDKLGYLARQSGLVIETLRAPVLPLSGSPVSRMLKQNLLDAGHFLVEHAVALLYFGGRKIPLSPNYMAVLSRAE